MLLLNRAATTAHSVLASENFNSSTIKALKFNPSLLMCTDTHFSKHFVNGVIIARTWKILVIYIKTILLQLYKQQ